MPDLISLGECMVELYCDGSIAEAPHFYKAYGGDTLNTAVAAARLGASAGFISKFGDDPFAPFLRAEIEREGVDLRCCPTVAGSNGLYLISLGTKGEREFTYYRAGSAASTLAPDDLDPDYIRAARLLHASGISQAISESSRRAVRAAFEIARGAGVRTSFDPNFRPKLWSAASAREALEEILPLTEVFLPSAADDGGALLLTRDAAEIAAFALGRGVGIVAVKQGEAGCALATSAGLRRIDGRASRPVDTSGAGDAFNGGFLYGLLLGLDPADAARLGATTAGLKVEGRGAVRSLPRRERVAEAARDEPWSAALSGAQGPRRRGGGSGVVAYIDGGSRGNPGPAGAGVYFELEGKPWRGVYEYLGRGTNNFAEYSALLRALDYAREAGFRGIEIYSDSELLVRQMRGEYRVKSPNLQALHREASDRMKWFERHSIRHVPRESNTRADALANKAMDLQRSGEDRYDS